MSNFKQQMQMQNLDLRDDLDFNLNTPQMLDNGMIAHVEQTMATNFQI